MAGARHDFLEGRMTMATSLLPVIGKPAPDFSLPSTTGETISLKQFKGKKTVVLYFYPKDETPGCTREACDFRDLNAEFEKFNTVILGVSTDGMESHQHFREKQRLPFPLLSDEDAAVSKMYGVYKQKNLYGKKSMGIERTTFVIDRTGRIAQIYPKVKVEGHVADLLEFVRED
jgi:peroxiredoxin Q/BCP